MREWNIARPCNHGHAAVDRKVVCCICSVGGEMKDRLAAALKYEQALIAYEGGKMTYEEVRGIYESWVGYFLKELTDETVERFIRDNKIGLI